MQKLLTFFSKNISVYAIFNDQSFNDTLSNDIVSFEQLGPGILAYAPAERAHDIYKTSHGRRCNVMVLHRRSTSIQRHYVNATLYKDHDVASTLKRRFVNFMTFH